MASVKGQAAVKRYLADLPATIEKKLLRGAGRAGAKVVMEEAKARSVSREVADKLEMRTASSPGRVTIKIRVAAGWARSLGIWQEYGTDPHFISVDDSQRQGMSVKRVNKLQKEGSLVIGGHFVGATVWHPGAQRHPFLRVALDLKEAEAVAAAQSYINSRITPAGIVGTAESDDE